MDQRPTRAERFRLAALFLGPALLVALAFLVVPALLHPGPDDGRCPQDVAVRRMREPVAMWRLHDPPLAPDGRLDVYAALRREVTPEAAVGWCRRDGEGPSREEIEAGDYASFPYLRRKGRVSPDADPPVPVLWERRGARRGGRVVAYSDGSVRFHDDAEADGIFRSDPGQE